MALSKLNNDSFADTAVHGRRNLVINGAMQVWQRGTSVTATSNGYSTADRWNHNASGGTLALSRQSLTVGQTDIPSQFEYFFRVNATTGNDNAGIRTRIEDVKTVQGTVTLSFYAKGTNPNGGNFEIELRQDFGSSGSSDVATTESFTVTSSWQRFTKTISVGSISGKTINAGSFYQVYFRQPDADTSTNAWTLDITGVQLEVGEQATPFEHRSFADELARCERYFWKTYNYDVAPGTASGASHLTGTPNATTSYFALQVPNVQMRDQPTSVIYNTNDGTTSEMRADSTDHPAAITGTSDHGGGAIYANNSAIGANNFVKAHLTMDAEL